MERKLIKHFPVATNTITVDVLEKPAEILVSEFSDKLFIVVTQIGKVGNLLEVKKEEFEKDRFSNAVYNIKGILGKDDEDLHVAARFFMNYINTSSTVLFALSLKDYKPETLKRIGECLKNHPSLKNPSS